MADLNTLTNKQLREKCLQFNLPNVPVTDSSRKVLIKKLNAVMTGKTPKTATPSNRRKTVAATITTTVSSGEEDDITVTTKRNTNASNRRTFMPSTRAEPTTTIPQNATKAYNQHIVPMQIEGRASSTRINDGYAPDPRQRRSVSLTKTGVLTTSYSQETVPLPKSYEENGEDDFEEIQDEDVDDVDMENIPNAQHTNYTQQNFTQRNYNPSNYNYNAGSFTTLPMPPPTEPSKPTLYPNLHATGLQNEYYNSLDDILASHSSSARQNKLGFSYNPPTSYIPSLSSSPPLNSARHTIGGSYLVDSGLPSTSPIPQHTSTSSSFLSSTTKRYTAGGGATKRHTARSIDDDMGASSSDDQYDAPYLSKFGRNLESYKPEPLVKRTSTAGYVSAGSPSVASRYSSYSPLPPKRRRGTYDNENVTFAQFWATLEQKYHLKQAFFFTMLFVAAVFIYVFFLQ